jgi:phosphoglycolate phosphatase-like HAD superfamily hydrolase
MKIKLFVDFDKTLFDTSQVKERLVRIFSQLGFSQSEIEQTYIAESLDGKFNPEGQAKRLCDIRPFNIEIAELKIKSMIFDSNKLLYFDTIGFLDDVDRNKYEVNLLSYGDEDFQKRKVKHSGIIDKFDNIYITNIEKQIYLKDIVKSNEYFVVIDDRGDALEKISKKFPKSFMILIVRNIENILRHEDFKGTWVRNLKQVLEYL